MNFAHLQIKVSQREGKFVGSWRAGVSPVLDEHHYVFESDLPLGKTMSQEKLEAFALQAISKATGRLEELHEMIASGKIL